MRFQIDAAEVKALCGDTWGYGSHPGGSWVEDMFWGAPSFPGALVHVLRFLFCYTLNSEDTKQSFCPTRTLINR